MNTNPASLGHYSSPNQALLSLAMDDVIELAEKWQDEASEAAVAGKPARARYIEDMISRYVL